VKAFPVVLELRFLWWTDPDVSTLADCDIPRTVRWGEMEYDFVAAILLDPGHWSSRVFHEDRLYSGQSGGKDWGCWLALVKETGWDTTEVAWKMTPKNLGGKFPARLYFTRRQRKNQSSVRKAPEGEWFRCGDTPCTENLPRQTPPPPTPHPTLISPAKCVENPVPTLKPDPTDGPTFPEIGNSGTSQDRTTPLPPAQPCPPAKPRRKQPDEKGGPGGFTGTSTDFSPHFNFAQENPPSGWDVSGKLIPEPPDSNGARLRHKNPSTRKKNVSPVAGTPVTLINRRRTNAAGRAFSKSATPESDGPQVDDRDEIKVRIAPPKRRPNRPPPQTPAQKKLKGPDPGSKPEVYMDAGSAEVFMEVQEPPTRGRSQRPPVSPAKRVRNRR
jgi:hypothetical protein